jgi:membrane protease YdiL (CAAX protease family)
VVVQAYLAAIAAAEALTALVNPWLGALVHIALLLLLLGHSVLQGNERTRNVLIALALVPLLRILSLVMPLDDLAPIWWHVLIGAPLLAAVFLALRAMGYSWADVGLGPGWSAPWWQLVIGLSGVPLGLLAYFLTRPTFPVVERPFTYLLGGAIILALFSGFLEELIFRGVVQSAAGELLGAGGMIVSALLYGVVYIGSLSITFVVFAALVGLFFSLCVRRTGSLWGAALAHSWLNIGLLLVWPLVAARLAGV